MFPQLSAHVMQDSQVYLSSKSLLLIGDGHFVIWLKAARYYRGALQVMHQLVAFGQPRAQGNVSAT